MIRFNVYPNLYAGAHPLPAIKFGVREFREQMAHYLESDVAVTRHGENLGVYVPTPRGKP